MIVERITPRIGARIREVDLAGGLDVAEWAEIESAWNAHHLLVFPDQGDLSKDAQVALLERFGPVLEERIPGEQHCFVSNELGHGVDEMNVGYREGELTPHMDFTYTRFPADAISLFGVSIPEAGTQTLFYSNVAPLFDMPADLRETLSGYSIFCAHDLSAMRPDARLCEEPRTRPDAPTQSHVWPLIRSHPRKPGVKFLFSTLQQTERIVELSDEGDDDASSRALLSRIFDQFLYTDANRYVHEWNSGDLVVWDNLSLQHAREACPEGQGRRTLRRVAVCEAGNAIHETVEFLSLEDSTQTFG